MRIFRTSPNEGIPTEDESAGRRLKDETAVSSATAPVSPALKNRSVENRNSTLTALKNIRQIRSDRALFFSPDLFADPAWDMIIELAICEHYHRKVAVTDLSLASGVPATTALRWLETLVRAGIVTRQPDLNDGRRHFCALSPAASENLKQLVRTQFR